MTDPCGALIYTMVLVCASDGAMTDNEINTLGEMIGFLPVFRDFDRSRLPALTEETISLLEEEEGLDRALDIIDRALPDHLRETAYAIACDVVASDATASQEELRLLEMLRHSLDVDRLSAAAIERGARARHMTLE